ncbi:tRNA intron endonuclease [Mucidula mucida]|nr:tRNA intron endonuclease [Mucidula mucida]
MFAPDTHPSNEALDALITKYPETSGCLFQVYNDILYAQSWTDVNVVDLGLVLDFPRGAVKGRRDAGTLVYVVPCALTEFLTYAWLQNAFRALENPSEIYLGISADDSSIVYYKLSAGIVKPPV